MIPRLSDQLRNVVLTTAWWTEYSKTDWKDPCTTVFAVSDHCLIHVHI